MVGRAAGGEDVLIVRWSIPGADPATIADDAVHYNVEIIQLGW
jgi:hypothetical protein